MTDTLSDPLITHLQLYAAMYDSLNHDTSRHYTKLWWDDDLARSKRRKSVIARLRRTAPADRQPDLLVRADAARKTFKRLVRQKTRQFLSDRLIEASKERSSSSVSRTHVNPVFVRRNGYGLDTPWMDRPVVKQ